jgi:type VI secretion system secreted protein Hcp
MSSVDIFLKLSNGIDGESQDKGHKGQIQIDSVSFGATQQANFAYGGGGGAGKVAFTEMHLTKQLDKASPNLFKNLAKGSHIDEAVITLRKAGGEQVEYCVFTFKQLIVSSQQISGSQGAVFMESVSLSFAEFKMEYKEQDEKGALSKGAVVGGWNVQTNQPVG